MQWVSVDRRVSGHDEVHGTVDTGRQVWKREKSLQELQEKNTWCKRREHNIIHPSRQQCWLSSAVVLLHFQKSQYNCSTRSHQDKQSAPKYFFWAYEFFFLIYFFYLRSLSAGVRSKLRLLLYCQVGFESRYRIPSHGSRNWCRSGV